MKKRCAEIDARVTPFVDGEIGPAEQEEIGRHLDACPPCRRSAVAERAGRQLVREHAGHLIAEAPESLRARCRASAGRRPGPWSLRRAPMALAATLVLAVAGALLYGTVINPTAAAAAQLTLDHLKCFTLFDRPDRLPAAIVRASLNSQYGWDIPIPDERAVPDLSLVGGRRCVYLDGALVHLLYKRGQVQVSVFVLPEGVYLPARALEMMGHSAVGFERDGRTWVVLARQTPAEVEKIAAAFETALPASLGGARRSE
jgi:anti-sigma factor (TIGR02949 family)